ncbi:MAG TPA: zinc ribbon domain-containing protein, partial [Bryobacteraceae bacterium]|nr:zinc ribbon domain-containing protein [Bryobacteraceae bacterium]
SASRKPSLESSDESRPHQDQLDVRPQSCPSEVRLQKELFHTVIDLVHCGHCGCLLVGELKKARYIYYHCTGNRGKCPEAYTRQETLFGQFANVLQELVIPPAIIDWLGDAVLNSDRTEQAVRSETIKKLQARYDQIEARVMTMYMDKLDGRITQESFDNQAATLRREQDVLLRKIQDIQTATPAPVDQAIDMLCLTSRASELFLQQPGSEQRRLVQTVVEKAAWKDGALQATLFEPFEILRHSNQESHRKEMEEPGAGRDLGIWLPKNHGFQPPLRWASHCIYRENEFWPGRAAAV